MIASHIVAAGFLLISTTIFASMTGSRAARGVARLLLDRALLWLAFALRLLGMMFFSLASTCDRLGFCTCERAKSMVLAILKRHTGVNDGKEP